MKVSIQVIGADAYGRHAAIWLSGDAKWAVLDVKDVVMAEKELFEMRRLEDLMISEEGIYMRSYRYIPAPDLVTLWDHLKAWWRK